MAHFQVRRIWLLIWFQAPTSSKTTRKFRCTAELPGLEEKDVQINLADNVLTIKGEKKAEKEEKDKIIVSSSVAMARSPDPSELPAGVDAGTIKASISKGILTVVIPKPAPAQAKKIEVKSAV